MSAAGMASWVTGLSSAANFLADPIGLAAEVPDTGASSSLRNELLTLRAGLRAILDQNQGIAAATKSDAGDGSALLLSRLEELLRDQRQEVDDAQREAQGLRQIVATLQDERRKYNATTAPSAAPPQPPPLPHAPPKPAEDAAVVGKREALLMAKVTEQAAELHRERALRVAAERASAPSEEAASKPVAVADSNATATATAAAIEEAVSAARWDERMVAASSRAKLDKEHLTALERAVSAEREAARTQAAHLARAQERRADAERQAACACLADAIGELDAGMRVIHEAHREELQAVRKRAAQMLAKKDAELAKRGSGSEPTPPTAGGNGGAAPAQRRYASVAVGPDEDEAARAVTATATLLAAQQGSGSTDALTSTFARRIGDLERTLASTREAKAALEVAREKDAHKVRVLGARMKAIEKGGGADMAYVRNVLLRWFAMTPTERGTLFPVLAAACAFTQGEVEGINRARAANAPSFASLWAPDDPGPPIFTDGPPGTPLAAPTPLQREAAPAPQRAATTTSTTSTTSTTTAAGGASPAPDGEESAAALQQKVAKLRWLLQCANAEMTKLRGAPAPGVAPAAAAP